MHKRDYSLRLFCKLLGLFLGEKKGETLERLGWKKRKRHRWKIFEFASREKMQELLGKFSNWSETNTQTNRTPRKFRILTHPLHLLGLMRFRNDYNGSGPVSQRHRFRRINSHSCPRVRDNRSAGSQCRLDDVFAALDTLSIHSGYGSERVVAIGHGPCSATPLQPPPRYLLALALLRALPKSAAGFATLAIYEENIARSRIKRPIKIESSDRVKIDSAGSILAPSFIPRMQLSRKLIF